MRGEPGILERAWRDGVIYERRLVSVDYPEERPSLWRNGDVVLVAGAGGLAALLARSALEAGAKVAVLGRRADPPPGLAELASNADGTSSLAYLRADLRDARAIEAAVEEAERRFAPLTIAFHTAMVMDDAPLALLTPERIGAVLERWDHLAIFQNGERVLVDGNGFTAIARLRLLNVLHELCREAGVEIRFRECIADLVDAMRVASEPEHCAHLVADVLVLGLDRAQAAHELVERGRRS